MAIELMPYKIDIQNFKVMESVYRILRVHFVHVLVASAAA
jgi:hypothetical protein